MKRDQDKRPSPWPRILGFFFAAMLILTMLSRAADALLLPVVRCARALPGTLKHTVTFSGAIEAREQLPVMAETGLVVSRVFVRQGQSVKAGEVLLRCDTAALQLKLDEKQTELKKRTLQAQLDALDQTSSDNDEKQLTPQKTDQQKATLTQQLNRLELDALQREVDRLSQLIHAGATLTSPVDGIVSELLVKPGDSVQGAVLRLSPASSGLVVRAMATMDQAKYLAGGMAASYMLPGDSKSREGAALVGLVPSGSGYEVTVELPEGGGGIGQTAHITASQSTDTFPTRVPLSAIANNGGQTGVFRIRTGQSVLGEMEYAEFVSAQIIESDMEHAAIQSALSSQDQVITNSSKPLRAGDRVRSTS